jgi:caffeoyl-CoA O-methyltransferase
MPLMKATGIKEDLYDYIVARRTAEDDLLLELRRETEDRFQDQAGMVISPDQGTLLGILVAATGAKRVLEVGTFTGYSSTCMARALPEDGYLLALDRSEEYTAVARSYWERAAVDGKIELRLAPALDSLRALPHEPPFDFAFIDAQKTEYWNYFEEILPRLRTGGLMAVDNVLWGGRIIDPENEDESTLALRQFSDRVAEDVRVDSVMLAIADGLTLIRKR